MKKKKYCSLTVKIIPLAFLLIAAASGVSHFVQNLLVPTKQGKPLYKIGAQTYYSGDLIAELLLTVKYNTLWNKDEKKLVAKRKDLKKAYLETRIASDLLYHEAKKRGLLKEEEFQIYLKMAVREAVKQYLFQRIIKPANVSGNEIEKFYNKYKVRLARLPFDKARQIIIKNIQHRKRKAAIVALIETLKKKHKLIMRNKEF